MDKSERTPVLGSENIALGHADTYVRVGQHIDILPYPENGDTCRSFVLYGLLFRKGIK